MNDLHYTFINNNQPVLLLIHGFLGSMQQWSYLEQDLLATHSLLKIDLPGHGMTSEFQENYTLEELSLRIDQILVFEKIEKVHIVGHSMGGYLGCAYANARPDKTRSLTLINSIASNDTKQRKLIRDRSIQLIEKHQAAFVSMAIGNLFTVEERKLYETRITLMKQQADQISIRSIIQALTCMRDRSDYLPLLKEVDFPITYIYGKQDNIVPLELVEKEQVYLRANARIIDNGHMSLLINPLNILKNMYFIE
ncbi:alpha/beta hydrolase [Nonlabens sp. Ci31]|uniref:alpha/beta fold hydrolase n=1 Tax=Nonlabens sp. Ci31 TaxID=2608253 RepID=UPI001462EEB9|nr:alpha/beta hydrolase [Nonlabens sp. Ci31]QJP33871.1 alpha/beta hydrolase [Nonlabens sp. Ci31]